MKIQIIHPRNGQTLLNNFDWAINASASSPDNFGKRFNNFQLDGKTLSFETHDVHVHLRAGQIGEFESDFSAVDGAIYTIRDSMVLTLNNQPRVGKVIIDDLEFETPQAALNYLRTL